MDRGAWRAAVHGVAKSQTRLNDKHTKSRQEHWSGLPFPSAGDLPNPGIKPRSPALQVGSLPLCYLESSLQKVHLQKEKPQ